ncbi:hypothetical protein NLJ89_g3301 [Agrocybe chaxingu]|uniref:Cytochrome P450 n=1 Tax=Agrocybe chaxingu TaxID=84603 RepID=A0A9W8K554_9AGAR|nr:hypothetical protein NLJ89_g3301 [Agrocybe chaxingu]
MFLPVLSIVILVLLYLGVAMLFKPGYKKMSPDLTYNQLMLEIMDILHPNASMEEHLRERAEANQRLIRALHISNTFVSADTSVHKTFVGHARLLLKGAQHRGWAHFQRIVAEAVEWQLSSPQPQHEQSHHIPLPPNQRKDKCFKFDSSIQNITLVVVLVGILQIDKPIQTLSHQDVTLVAERITTLWRLSKKPGLIPPNLLTELTAHLRSLVPMNDVDDELHFMQPLDFVIPTWETLWRVVATTVAYAHGDAVMRREFEAFNADPSEERFQRGGWEDRAHKADGVNVMGIVSETMRLHPPSKHIGRSKMKWRWCPSFLVNWIGQDMIKQTKHADIEKLLRCEIWGPDADEFKPARHRPGESRPEHKSALACVFGHGPLRCIASSWAPMAVGVISGIVLDQLDSNGYVVHAGQAIGSREGWNDWVIKETQ